MSSNFESVVKEVIKENELQDLSSEGWSRMKKVRRALEAKEITLDEAVEAFLEERDFLGLG